MRIVMILLAAAAVARAQVVDVRDDEGLKRALEQAKPGVTIRIAPGTYRGGVFATLRGEKDRPIVIAGADADRPPVFVGGTAAFQFSESRYLTLRNLTLRGMRQNGLNIDDGGKLDHSTVGFVIEKIRVHDV